MQLLNVEPSTDLQPAANQATATENIASRRIIYPLGAMCSLGAFLLLGPLAVPHTSSSPSLFASAVASFEPLPKLRGHGERPAATLMNSAMFAGEKVREKLRGEWDESIGSSIDKLNGQQNDLGLPDVEDFDGEGPPKPQSSGSQELDKSVAVYRTYDNSRLSVQLDNIMSAKPSLSTPSYEVTPWLRKSKLNFGFATLRSRLGALRQKMDPPFFDRISSTAHPDVTVEWAKDPINAALPADAPIVIFMHTITGSAAQSRWLTTYASKRGWRSCTFVRRGHGDRLHAPSFDILGTIGDVQLQLAAVQEQFPKSKFLTMMGISAGSGQLLSYLGRAGDSTPIRAASAICPAWDTRAAFEELQYTQPLAEKAMLRTLKSRFLGKQNKAFLQAWNRSAVEACLKAETLPEFVEAHIPFAMHEHNASLKAYYKMHDPLAVRHGVKIPVLLINAEDDFVSTPNFAKTDIIEKEQPGTLMFMTKTGSHVAFNEGVFARDAFHLRTSFDFFDGALETARVVESIG